MNIFSKNIFKTDLFIFAGIQIVLTAVIFGVAMFPGCSEELEEQQGPLGPQVTIDQLAQAFLDALNRAPMNSLGVGDRLLYEDNVRVDLSGVAMRYSYDRSLKAIEDLPDKTRLVLEEVKTDYISEPTPKQTKSDIFIDLAKANLQSAVKAVGELQALSPQVAATKLELAEAETRESFHDLSVSVQRRSPPKRVKDQPDCQGIPDCQIEVTEIKYTLAIWNGPTLKARFDFTTVVSPSLPYLGQFSIFPIPLLEECARYLVDNDGRKYFVSECTVLRDFEDK